MMNFDQNVTSHTTMAVENPPVPDGMHATTAYILSNLYANPEEAVIREYVANGLDATEAAGSTQQVEVVLPDALDQDLMITDYGTGMTSHEVKTHFAAYGNSSKKLDSSAIGQIGAGAKSGFAVSTMIQVETTRDGETSSFTYVWHKEHGPQMTGFTVEHTEKPNGTTITIPADPSRDWENAAYRALAYTGGRVMVDGETFADQRGEHPTAVHRMSFTEADTMQGHRIVMGGMNFRVPEPLAKELVEEVQWVDFIRISNYFVVEVPNKAMDFSPSREDVKDTPANLEALREVLETQFRQPINETYLGETPWETYTKIRSTSTSDVVLSAVTCEIKDHLHTVGRILSTDVGYTAYGNHRETVGGSTRSRNGSIRSTIDGLDIGTDNMLFVHDPEEKISRSPKIRAWLLDRHTPSVIIPIEDTEQYQQIERAGLHVMTSDELRAYKPVRSVQSTKRSICYETCDLDQAGIVRGFSQRLAVEEITERYDMVYFKPESAGVPKIYHLTWDENLAIFQRAFPSKIIGVVTLMPQASEELAIKRIGLPVADLQSTIDDFVATISDAVSSEHLRLLDLLDGLSRYSSVAGKDVDGLRDMLKIQRNNGHRFFDVDSDMQILTDIVNTVDVVTEHTGMEPASEMEEISTVLHDLTSTDWITDMMNDLRAAPTELDVETRLKMICSSDHLRTFTEHQGVALSDDAQSLIRAFFHTNAQDRHRIEVVAGRIVSQSVTNLATDHHDELSRKIA